MNFKYSIVEGNYIKIEEYLGKETIVKIPNTIKGKPVRVVGKGCFFSNDTIEKIIFPKNIKTIEEGSIVDCPNLKEIEINSIISLKNIFIDCKEEITVISNVKKTD